MVFINFILQNWADLLLIVVGGSAFFTYCHQQYIKRKNAAALIILQINEITNKICEINTFVTQSGINETSFYEMLPLIKTNYWELYKHLFIGKMNAESYRTLNDFYEYAEEIQEQQSTLKNLQNSSFQINQGVITNLEEQMIMKDVTDLISSSENFKSGFQQIASKIQSDNSCADLASEVINRVKQKDQNFDIDEFWRRYSYQKRIVECIFSNKSMNTLTTYSPAQISSSLEKTLKKYELLEVKASDGYKVLQKIAKVSKN